MEQLLQPCTQRKLRVDGLKCLQIDQIQAFNVLHLPGAANLGDRSPACIISISDDFDQGALAPAFSSPARVPAVAAAGGGVQDRLLFQANFPDIKGVAPLVSEA